MNNIGRLALLGFFVYGNFTNVAMAELVTSKSTIVEVNKMLSFIENDEKILLNQASIWESQLNANITVEVPKKALKIGSKGKDVKLLCEALELRDFGKCNESNIIDEEFESRIKAAQIFYGLEDDGLASVQLYNALSLSSAQKANIARLTAEDLKKIRLSADEKNIKKAIIVNIPSFNLNAFDENGLNVNSKVIIGQPSRQTPIGQMNILALKYNPNWTPPDKILSKNIYPSLDGDGSWIKSHGLILYDESGQVVDIESVTSEDVKANGYKFVQPAGNSAALGKLKFETDSKNAIYLHDTNERFLFKKSTRDISSGCIRVEKWEQLASWVSGETIEGIQKEVNKKRTSYQKTEKTPVFIGYRLADVINGKVVIFPNVYNKKV